MKTKRMKNLLYNIILYIIDNTSERSVAISELFEMGFKASEIKALGFDWIFEEL